MLTMHTEDGPTVTYLPRAHAFVIQAADGEPTRGRWPHWDHTRELFLCLHRQAAEFKLGRYFDSDVLWIQDVYGDWSSVVLFISQQMDDKQWWLEHRFHLKMMDPGLDMAAAARRLQRFARGVARRRQAGRSVAVAMAWHARLGAGSLLGGLDPGLLRAILAAA